MSEELRPQQTEALKAELLKDTEFLGAVAERLEGRTRRRGR